MQVPKVDFGHFDYFFFFDYLTHRSPNGFRLLIPKCHFFVEFICGIVWSSKAKKYANNWAQCGFWGDMCFVIQLTNRK